MTLLAVVYTIDTSGLVLVDRSDVTRYISDIDMPIYVHSLLA